MEAMFAGRSIRGWRALLGTKIDVDVDGGQHVSGELLSVVGGRRPSLWLVNASGEDVVLSLGSINAA